MSMRPTMAACLTRGACCESYRVEFSAYEIDAMGGSVSESLTEVVNGGTCRMKGTGTVPIRCAALAGTVGQSVGCTIYNQRPRPCAELQEGTYRCNKAMVRHGLLPLGEWLGN